MRRSIPQNGLAILTAFTVVAIASSADAALLTTIGTGSSWSAPLRTDHSCGLGLSAEACGTSSAMPLVIDAPPLQQHDCGSAPAGMSGPNSSQTHSSAAVAILSSSTKQFARGSSVAAVNRPPVVVTIWRGDEMLDPPKGQVIVGAR